MSDLIYRNITLTREDINEEERTVILTFSSETAVSRSFGLEVLGHKSGEVDLSFLSSGNAPLLLQHDQDEVIGVVETAEIVDESVGVAKVRFSKSDLAESIFKDVLDGIRKNISVGYSIIDTAITTINEQRVVRCVWYPQEISVVSIPADKSIGIGRAEEEISNSIERKLNNINTNNNNNKGKKMSEEIQNHNIDLDGIKSESVKQERARIAEITTIASRHNVSEIAHDFISNGKSVEEFRAAVLDQLAKQSKTVVTPAMPIGMSEKEVKQYSLSRAVKAMISGDWRDAGLELEASRAHAEMFGRMQTNSNLFIPMDYMGRAADANAVKTTGGHFVATNQSGSFIDQLFNATIAAKLGVKYLSGLRGDLEIPKVTSGPTAAWITEGNDLSVSAVGQSSVTLSPKTLGALVEYTRKMALQSEVVIEQMLRDQISQKIAVALDAAVFNAGGSGAPVGILGSADVTAWESVPDNLAYTYADIYEMIKNVDIANALTDNCKFAMSPVVSAILSTKLVDSNTAAKYLIQDRKMIGYDVVTSNNVGNNIIFGDFSNVMVGSWSGIELAVDTSVRFSSGGYQIRAITDADVAVLRGEAFSGYKNASTDPTP